MKRDVQMYLGGVIRDLRINRGITQEKLAELSDLDPTHISMILPNMWSGVMRRGRRMSS